MNDQERDQGREQLPQDLLAAATEARARAYVPYSHFAVGAALRTEDGRIFAGANIENASYGLSRCAEQSAVLAMVNAGTQASERVIREVLVIADGSTAVSPCGACRQIIWEFGQNATVHMTNLQGDVLTLAMKELLPAGFVLEP
jgi:cytidine deaminase